MLSSGGLQVKAGSPVADAPAFAPTPSRRTRRSSSSPRRSRSRRAGSRSSARRAWRSRRTARPRASSAACPPTRPACRRSRSTAAWTDLVPALGTHVVGNTASEVDDLAARGRHARRRRGRHRRDAARRRRGRRRCPTRPTYTGEDGDEPTGLFALEHVPEISIVAAPAVAADADNHDAVCAALVTHVELHALPRRGARRRQRATTRPRASCAPGWTPRARRSTTRG